MASVLASTVWHDTLDHLDPDALTRDGAYPPPEAVERQVRAAFDPLDPTGRMADECWRDVSRKVDRWHAARASVEAFAAAWDTHRAALRALVATPDVLTRALTEARAPARIAELDPPAPEPTVRWALHALPLMRDRFTVADLRFFAGEWDARRSTTYSLAPGSSEYRCDRAPDRPLAAARPTRRFGGYVFDLDGTLYLGDRLLPGAAATVASIRDGGARVAFLTNKPSRRPPRMPPSSPTSASRPPPARWSRRRTRCCAISSGTPGPPYPADRRAAPRRPAPRSRLRDP